MNIGGIITEFASLNPNDTEALEGAITVMDMMDNLLKGWVFWDELSQPVSDVGKLVPIISRTYPTATSGNENN